MSIWLLFGLAATSTLLAVAVPPIAPPGGTSISADDANALRKEGGALLVDIRRPDEWQVSGRPAGAIGVTLEDPDFVKKIASAAGNDPQRMIILICRSGRRTLVGMNMLHQAGFAKACHIGAGMIGSEHGPGWIERDLPIEPYND